MRSANDVAVPLLGEVEVQIDRHTTRGRGGCSSTPQALQDRSYNSSRFDEFLFCEWG